MSKAGKSTVCWDKFSSFVHEKTLRERVIILFVVVVLIYGLADILFLGGILENRSRQLNQLNALLESNQVAQQEVQDLLDQIGEGRLAMQRQQQLLNEKLNHVDRQLASAAMGFIPATLMPKVLEQLLDNSEQLVLLKLENKPVERVTGLDDLVANEGGTNYEGESNKKEPITEALVVDDTSHLYRHGVELQLQGSYLSTLAYLKRLEQLQWRFEWDSLVFEVQKYPIGTVTLEVYTYSTERDWIGV